MSYTVRALGAGDNAALLALCASRDTGSSRFRVERGPDFAALGRWLGQSVYYGVFSGSELVGSLGVTRQLRFLEGRAVPVHYLHDLRVHPARAGSRAILRLVEHARAAHAGEASWFLATVLAENRHAQRLLRRGRFLPTARVIGHTRHVGLPLFLPRLRKASGVVELDAETAWRRYVELASRRDFAPADRARFVAGAEAFLGLGTPGAPRAVCRVVDQTAARRIVACAPLGAPARVAGWLCRATGRAALPAPGSALRFVYLSHAVAEAPLELAEASRRFAAYWSRRAAAYSHAFVGLSADQPWRGGPFTTELASVTYALGDAPRALVLDFHELSLI